MEILYIDVYFLLNFTIDTLAVYFATKLVRIRVTLLRLILLGAIGAFVAVVDVFFGDFIVGSILNTITFLLSLMWLISQRLTLVRRIKFIVAFYIIELLIGGTVSYAYNLLDKYFADFIKDIYEPLANRGAIIFSLIILLVIGVLRIIIMLFSGNTDGKNVVVKIELEDKTVECEALLDSGNLVKDPMSMCPVLFIKPHFARVFLPKEIMDLSGIDELNNSYRRRIRLIPVSRGGKTTVLTGIRADRVCLKGDKGFYEVDLTVVIDKEDGSYSGYSALAPSVVVEK